MRRNTVPAHCGRGTRLPCGMTSRDVLCPGRSGDGTGFAICPCLCSLRCHPGIVEYPIAASGQSKRCSTYPVPSSKALARPQGPCARRLPLDQGLLFLRVLHTYRHVRYRVYCFFISIHLTLTAYEGKYRNKGKYIREVIHSCQKPNMQLLK